MSDRKTIMSAPDAMHPHHGRDLNWLLDYRAASRRDHPFLIWHPFVGPGETWTYGRFQERVLRLAAGLYRRGVREGDAVLIHLDNGVPLELVWFACARLGAIAVTTNTRSAGDELKYYAEHCGAVGVVTSPEHLRLFEDHVPDLRWVFVTDRGWDGAVLGAPAGAEALADVDGDPADLPVVGATPWRYGSVQYTSGTTSRPKGVLWTQGNALVGAQGAALHEHLTPDAVHLVTMPQFHTNARNYSILPTMWVGATAVLTPKFSTSRFWDVSRRYGCTHASLLRFFYKILLEQDRPTSHSYRVWNAGAKDDRLETAFGLRSLGHYGSTETVGPALATDLHSEARNGTVGHPALGYEIRVVDDDNRPVVDGEVGHLQVRGRRGAQIFCEYLHAEEATRDAFAPDGWFITGDRVTIGADGAVSFVDRAKDMLKVGGENISAAEIERVVMSVPGVDEVAVVGKPDDRGDVPVAFVVAHDSVALSDHGRLSDAIASACRERLADFKRPREVIIVSEMPRAALEKINKVELRKRLQLQA